MRELTLFERVISWFARLCFKSLLSLSHRTEEEYWQEVYELEKMARGDYWHDINDGMPNYDGRYLCFVEKTEPCGNIYHFQQICVCNMNQWVTDSTERVMFWNKLGESPNW